MGRRPITQPHSREPSDLLFFNKDPPLKPVFYGERESLLFF